MARLPGFAKLSPTERIEALLKEGLLTWDEAQILKRTKGTSPFYCRSIDRKCLVDF